MKGFNLRPDGGVKRLREFKSTGLGVVLVLSVVLPVRSESPTPAGDVPPKVEAASALLIDAQTETVLYEKAAHERRYPASLTKVVTALLLLERGNLKDMVTISKVAASVGEASGNLKEGERIRLLDLLYLILLKSANDACVAVSEHLAGSESEFVNWMNERAQELGATDTNFANPHGLHDPDHYTSAWDMALLARCALQHPLFRRVVTTKKWRIAHTNKSARRVFKNHNKLLWHYPGADGVKTGYTSQSGKCLIASATRQGWQLISVVMKSPDPYADTKRLFNYGFSNFTCIYLANAKKPSAFLRIPLGEPSRLAALPMHSFAVVVRKGEESSIKTRIRQLNLTPPIRRGQVVGQLQINVPKKPVHLISLVAGSSVNWSKVYVRRKRIVAALKGFLLVVCVWFLLKLRNRVVRKWKSGSRKSWRRRGYVLDGGRKR